MNDYEKWFGYFGNTPRSPLIDPNIQPPIKVIDPFEFKYDIDLLEKINKLKEEVKSLKKQIKDKE